MFYWLLPFLGVLLSIVVLGACLLVTFFGIAGIVLLVRRVQRGYMLSSPSILAAVLSPQERLSIKVNGWFEVPSYMHPGERYRIFLSPQHAPEVWKGKEGYAYRLCIGFANDALPHTDYIVMLKLLAEGDEIRLRETAGHLPGRNESY